MAFFRSWQTQLLLLLFQQKEWRLKKKFLFSLIAWACTKCQSFQFSTIVAEVASRSGALVVLNYLAKCWPRFGTFHRLIWHNQTWLMHTHIYTPMTVNNPWNCRKPRIKYFPFIIPSKSLGHTLFTWKCCRCFRCNGEERTELLDIGFLLSTETTTLWSESGMLETMFVLFRAEWSQKSKRMSGK